MKTSCLAILLLSSILAGAQTAGNTTQTTANQPVLPAPTASSPVSRDAISTVWERTVYERGPNGAVIPRKHRYTELSSGLNYRQNGQWRPSREKIDLLPPGGAFAAAATNGQSQAWFPLDIARGVIQFSGPDGKQLTSRPVGLFFEDDSNSVLVAILTNSVGELVGSNQVVYPNAFEGAAANLRYIYTKAGFEQDVVVKGQLPDPAALGLIPARTRLGVLTAFFDTNNPVVTPGPTDPQTGMSDSTLTFGNVKISRGRAFSIGDTAQIQPSVVTAASWLNWITNAVQKSSSSLGGTPSYKRWFQLNGRNFLMEEVLYRLVAAQLEQLPPATGRLNTFDTNLLAGDSFLKAIPARLLAHPASGELLKTQTMRLSRVDFDQTRAVVLDYPVEVNSGGDYTFQGDTTYVVSGPCYLENVTIEGGAVIKYYNFNSFSWPYTQLGWWGGTAFIEVDGTLTCQTSSYHPAIFTAYDDDTVGEQLYYSTGNPAGNFYANPAIYSPNNNLCITNVRISYADLAVLAGDGCSITLSDSQVIDSQIMAALGLNDGYSGYVTLTCNNCLYNGLVEGAVPCGLFVLDLNNASDTYYLNNCTMDNLYSLGGTVNLNFGYAFNSVFANINSPGYNLIWQGGHNGYYNCQDQVCKCNPFTFGSNPITTYGNPFQTSRGGKYYLANNTFRGQGDPYISPNLLADLATKTTHPPDISHVGNTISSDNFNTHVSRDSLSPGPDLGYHYDPLDYVFQNSTIGANMTFPAGTAVGWQGQGLSFSGSDHTVNFNGTVNHPCYFVRCNTVQEADASGDGTGFAGSGLDNAYVHATFTRFSALGDLAVFFDGNWINADSIYNCEFWSGLIGGNATVELQLICYNCLFDRSSIFFSLTANSAYGDFELHNCTLRGGNLELANYLDDYISILDSAIDGTTLAVNNGSYSFSHNAYLSVATPLPGDQVDVFVSDGFNWQSGPLGNFYLPPHGPATQDGRLLIDAGDQQASEIDVIVDGSTGAQRPLSSFTTQTSQTLDSGAVDIGYHYSSLFVLPAILISGNNAADGNGPIETYNFSDGTQVGSFVPDDATASWRNGRGIAILATSFFYTELHDTSTTWGPSDSVHVCPYGTQGSGGHDTRTIKNPRHDANGNPVGGIQDLAFHYDSTAGKTELYALTGYINQTPIVYEIDPDSPDGTVTVIGSPISISGPADDCDGFTVLPNGDFLINDGDASPVYREYYGSGQNAGHVRTQSQGGLYVDLSNFGFNYGTGVTVSPDGNSLYFIAGIETLHQTLLLTDLFGNLFGTQPISSSEIEDIDVVIPQ